MNHFTELNERQRAEQHSYPKHLALRVHRALSWLGKAESCVNDEDAQFIFLWIAFNAAYANDVAQYHRVAEHQAFDDFIKKLCKLDKCNRLSNIVWQDFAGAIRVLLSNEHVFQPFWEYQNGYITEVQWKSRLENSRHHANRALGRENTAKVLAIVFERIYTLRNQMIHGGATYNSSVNRKQMHDCCHLMLRVVPTIIEIMMDNPKALWGEAYYPAVIN